MRLVILAALLLAPSVAYSQHMTEIRRRMADSQGVRARQEKCENYLARYSNYAHSNQEFLRRTAWDRPKGFVDPSAINEARYYFQDVYADLRDEIDRIQRSRDPVVSECRRAYMRAYRQTWNYTRELLLRDE